MTHTEQAAPPRAPALTRITDAALEQGLHAHQAVQVANLLLIDGYTITSIQLDTAERRPAVWVAYEARLESLVCAGEAAYYKYGVDSAGYYRVGYYPLEGCAVKWMDRPRRGRHGEWRH